MIITRLTDTGFGRGHPFNGLVDFWSSGSPLEVITISLHAFYSGIATDQSQTLLMCFIGMAAKADNLFIGIDGNIEDKRQSGFFRGKSMSGVGVVFQVTGASMFAGHKCAQ